MKTKLAASFGVLIVVCLLAGSVAAMSSTDYRLDWFTPLTSGGGGTANSVNFALNLTIGQTAIGSSSSTNYAVDLGYWYGIAQQLKVYLPIVVR